MSKFFFNDVEVSEADYNRLCAETVASAEAAEVVLPSRKVAKRAAPAVTEVLEPVKAKKGSKSEVAVEVIRRVGVSNKTACVEAIVAALGVTKGNASCYFFNAVKKGLV